MARLQDDYIFLKFLFKYCTYLGMAPFHTRQKGGSVKIYRKFFILVILITHLYFKVQVVGPLTSINYLTRNIWIATDMCFICVAVLSPNFILSKNWKKFYANLSKFEQGLGTMKFTSRKKKAKLILQTALMLGGLAVCHLQ
ncbi:hypothetical protein JTB14_013464 [Gonioctena quinquepunctata]|nr:hypothetical protein JTB14_013464 [Gonioctena quinquepunctata]